MDGLNGFVCGGLVETRLAKITPTGLNSRAQSRAEEAAIVCSSLSHSGRAADDPPDIS